jgi:hypothetical protein
MVFEGIRSERQLLMLAADRLSVRWYLGYLRVVSSKPLTACVNGG